MARRVKIAINGFGRIGRNVLRAVQNHSDIEVVAINDLTNARCLGHLLKYDSVHGRFNGTLEVRDDALIVNGKVIQILAQLEPNNLPWKKLGIDIVIESTGLFTSRAQALQHLEAGAKKVVISAPATNEDITIIMGVNETKYNPQKDQIISSSSCTGICLAPVAKVLHENFKIIKGTMTTVHSYTNDQHVLDLPHNDLRKARAATLSIIPTLSGAPKALGLVLPELKGKIDGFALRVPTPNVSVIDLVVQVEKKCTPAEINGALCQAAENSLKGILSYTTEPVVSVDFMSDHSSAIIDTSLTMVLENNLVKVISWYDNETGYSARVVDLLQYIAAQGL